MIRERWLFLPCHNLWNTLSWSMTQNSTDVCGCNVKKFKQFSIGTYIHKNINASENVRLRVKLFLMESAKGNDSANSARSTKFEVYLHDFYTNTFLYWAGKKQKYIEKQLKRKPHRALDWKGPGLRGSRDWCSSEIDKTGLLSVIQIWPEVKIYIYSRNTPCAVSTVADGKVKHLRPMLISAPDGKACVCLVIQREKRNHDTETQTTKIDRAAKSRNLKIPISAKRANTKTNSPKTFCEIQILPTAHPTSERVMEWRLIGLLEKGGMIIGKRACVDLDNKWRHVSVSRHRLGTRRNWSLQTI